MPSKLFKLSSLYDQVYALNNNGITIYKPREIVYLDVFLFYTCSVLLSTSKFSGEAVNSGVFSTLTVPVQFSRLFNLLSDVRKFENNYIYEVGDHKCILRDLLTELENELAVVEFEKTTLYDSGSDLKYIITDLKVLHFQLQYVKQAVFNLLNAETGVSFVDQMFNLLARFGSRLPATKRELVTVDSLRRVFDATQAKTRIKGPRKLTWLENKTVVAGPADDGEPLRLYLCLSYLFHGKTDVSTLFTARSEVVTMSGDYNT